LSLLGGGATDATGTGGNVVLAEGSGTTAANYGTIQIGTQGSKTRGFVSGTQAIAVNYFDVATVNAGTCIDDDQALGAGEMAEWTSPQLADNVHVVPRLSALVAVVVKVGSAGSRTLTYSICNLSAAPIDVEDLVGTLSFFVTLAP